MHLFIKLLKINWEIVKKLIFLSKKQKYLHKQL